VWKITEVIREAEIQTTVETDANVFRRDSDTLATVNGKRRFARTVRNGSRVSVRLGLAYAEREVSACVDSVE